jgi:hypothetical protein
MRALIQRLVPTTVPDAGGSTPTAAEEQAAIVLDAKHRAEARRLLPTEIEEVSEMPWLAPPQGPGLVAGPGTRKLVDAAGRLGPRLAGPVASYARDPATEAGPPSFVLGKLDDPDGRITVRGDGLLEVTRFRRIPQRAKKGQPKPPDKVVPDTAIVDLQGARIAKPPKPEDIGAAFYDAALKAVENEKAGQVLGELRASKTALKSGDPTAEPMALGEFVSEATSGTYWQFSYFDKAGTRPTELLKKVTAAFDQLRAEFGEWGAPLAMLGVDQQQRARAFAAKLQPGLFTAVAAAQSELDQATSEQDAAKKKVDAAKTELAALKARKSVPKEERAAYKDELTAAQTRSAAAGKRLSEADTAVKVKTRIVDGLAKERDTFVTTITWILDPSASATERATATVGWLCNVLSYYLYGKAVGLIPADTDFKDYYLAEVKKGDIIYWVGTESSGVYWGQGSWKWEQERNLIRLDDPNAKPKTPTTPEIPPKPIGDPSRQDQLRAFLASGANVALSWQDFKHTPPEKPHHFIPIVKDDHGVWRNMDQTSSEFRRRGGITDWGRVYRIDVDKALYQKPPSGTSAAAPAAPVPVAP